MTDQPKLPTEQQIAEAVEQIRREIRFRALLPKKLHDAVDVLVKCPRLVAVEKPEKPKPWKYPVLTAEEAEAEVARRNAEGK